MLIRVVALALLAVAQDDRQFCEKNFEMRPNTILDVSGSERAEFLTSVKGIATAEDCEYQCCQLERCNVAIFESHSEGLCYMIDCGRLNDFECQFAEHANYTAIGLMEDRIQFDRARKMHEQDLRRLHQSGDQKTNQSVPIKDKKQQFGYVPMPVQQGTANCHPDFEWACWHGNPPCIAKYNLCTGIPQCADGSDEDPNLCNKLTAQQNQPRQRIRPYPHKTVSPDRKTSIADVQGDNEDVPSETRSEGSSDVKAASRAMNPDTGTVVETSDGKNISSAVLAKATELVNSVKRSNRLTITLLGGSISLLALLLVYISCRIRHRPWKSGRVNNRRKGFKPLPQKDFDSDSDQDGLLAKYVT